MAFASALPGRADLAHLPLDRRLHAQGPVDADRRHRRLLPRLRVRAARARRPPAPDAVEPARGARRRGLLDPRARRARRRSARRGDDRGQHAGRDAAPPAARRARSDDAAAQGDGGDRRRGLHLRRGPRAEVRQPRRRAPARRSPPSARSAAAPRSSGWRTASKAKRRASSTPRFPAASAAGRSGAARSARAAGRTSCWCSRT